MPVGRPLRRREGSGALAAGFGPSFGVEALELGLGRVVGEPHQLGDGGVARLLRDERCISWATTR